MSNLAEIVRQKLSQKSEDRQYTYGRTALLTRNKSVLVGTACLELSSTPLHQNIIQFSTLALNSGITQVNIVPLFLSPGVHVEEDIPSEVSIAQQQLQRKIDICLQPYLGSNVQIKKLLQQEFNRLNTEGKILLAHGSRRQGGNQPIENMAKFLQASPAYWSVFPSLNQQINNLKNRKIREIGIVPYFLFTGGITEAIAQQVKGLQLEYPQIKIILGNPLEKNSQLANLIVESL